MGDFGNTSGKGIYTLAVSRTSEFENVVTSTPITGTGSDIGNFERLHSRAKRKVIVNSLMRAMADIANENGETKLAKGYWNTFYCQNELVKHEGKYYTDYCKNRWCATCCGIRKAHIINKYFPIISQWQEPHLLTLTIKSVRGEQLANRINEITKTFTRIKDRCNKRHSRGKGMKIMGIKSLECNFNATQKWYNPHFHIITPNRVTALYLKQEWKKEWNKNYYQADEKGQDLRPVANTEKDLVEVIKYGAKILSDPDPTHKKKRKKGDMKGLQIYARALHTIYKAFKKHHLFSSFGFTLPPEVAPESTEQTIYDYERLKYNNKLMDWENTVTGELFTEFEIDGYLDYILKTQINKELC